MLRFKCGVADANLSNDEINIDLKACTQVDVVEDKGFLKIEFVEHIDDLKKDMMYKIILDYETRNSSGYNSKRHTETYYGILKYINKRFGADIVGDTTYVFKI